MESPRPFLQGAPWEPWGGAVEAAGSGTGSGVRLYHKKASAAALFTHAGLFTPDVCSLGGGRGAPPAGGSRPDLGVSPLVLGALAALPWRCLGWSDHASGTASSACSALSTCPPTEMPNLEQVSVLRMGCFYTPFFIIPHCFHPDPKRVDQVDSHGRWKGPCL
jgi:hypothetical protein